MADFRITGINHIGIAPKDPDLFESFLGKLLNLSKISEETVASQQTTTAIFASVDSRSPSHEENLLEVLRPSAQDQGPIADFLQKRGSGIHHLALTVDRLEPAIAALRSQGIEMIHKTPAPGVCKTRIAFIHPRSTGGILVELVENP